MAEEGEKHQEGFVPKSAPGKGPDTVAHQIATDIARGIHPEDIMWEINTIDPDLSGEALRQLQIETLIKAAGIRATEQLKDNYNSRDLPIPSIKNIIRTYQDAFHRCDLHIDDSDAERLLKSGIEFYKTLAEFRTKEAQ